MAYVSVVVTSSYCIEKMAVMEYGGPTKGMTQPLCTIYTGKNAVIYMKENSSWCSFFSSLKNAYDPETRLRIIWIWTQYVGAFFEIDVRTNIISPTFEIECRLFFPTHVRVCNINLITQCTPLLYNLPLWILSSRKMMNDVRDMFPLQRGEGARWYRWDDDSLTLSWTYVGYCTRLCSGQTDGR